MTRPHVCSRGACAKQNMPDGNHLFFSAAQCTGEGVRMTAPPLHRAALTQPRLSPSAQLGHIQRHRVDVACLSQHPVCVVMVRQVRRRTFFYIIYTPSFLHNSICVTPVARVRHAPLSCSALSDLLPNHAGIVQRGRQLWHIFDHWSSSLPVGAAGTAGMNGHGP